MAATGPNQSVEQTDVHSLATTRVPTF